MTKLCPRGKAAAKRKFRVYPSAYANAYASKICAGKIKDPSGKKRKDWGPKKAKVGMAVSAGSQSALGRLQKSGLQKAKEGRMFTAAEFRALDESTSPKANPKKKERIMQSGDKDRIKLSKSDLKRFSVGGGADMGDPNLKLQKKIDQKRAYLNSPKRGERKNKPFTGERRTGEARKRLEAKGVKAFQGGGMARGMGAAIKGGKFEGVF